MLIEDLDLPYDYADNTRAGTVTYVALSVLLTAAMAGVTLFGLYAIPWWVVAAPVALVIHRSYLFSIYRNATHEALRDAEADRMLDDLIRKRAASADRNGAILTPDVFAQRIIEGKDV